MTGTAEADVFVWDGKDIDGLRKFVAPMEADHAGRVAGIPGLNHAELLVPGNCILRRGPGHFVACESEEAAKLGEVIED